MMLTQVQTTRALGVRQARASRAARSVRSLVVRAELREDTVKQQKGNMGINSSPAGKEARQEINASEGLKEAFNDPRNRGEKPAGGEAGGLASGGPLKEALAGDSDLALFWEQEYINGRAAMLGFVAAVISELSTGQSVVSQIIGKRNDALELIEQPNPNAILGFGLIFFLVTLSTVAPRFIANLALDSKSFGPFTPPLERLLGRTAMLGFFGLVITELVKGSAVF